MRRGLHNPLQHRGIEEVLHATFPSVGYFQINQNFPKEVNTSSSCELTHPLQGYSFDPLSKFNPALVMEYQFKTILINTWVLENYEYLNQCLIVKPTSVSPLDQVTPI